MRLFSKFSAVALLASMSWARLAPKIPKMALISGAISVIVFVSTFLVAISPFGKNMRTTIAVGAGAGATATA